MIGSALLSNKDWIQIRGRGSWFVARGKLKFSSEPHKQPPCSRHTPRRDHHAQTVCSAEVCGDKTRGATFPSRNPLPPHTLMHAALTQKRPSEKNTAPRGWFVIWTRLGCGRRLMRRACPVVCATPIPPRPGSALSRAPLPDSNPRRHPRTRRHPRHQPCSAPGKRVAPPKRPGATASTARRTLARAEHGNPRSCSR